MRRLILTLILLLPLHKHALAAVPLIPRDQLFGNPVRYASQISPDANWLSWLAPHKGVMNLWVAPLRHLKEARPLTRETGHGISSFTSNTTWTYDSRYILFLQDHNGDGNTHVYAADIQTSEVRDLTPLEGVRAAIVGVSSAVPDQAVISITQKAAQYGDLYKLDLRDGTQTPLLKNPGYLNFLLDHHLIPRFAIRREASNDETVIRLSDGSAFLTIPAADVRTTRLLAIASNGTELFALDSRGRDTAALVKFDLSTGAETVLGEDKRADVQDVALDERTRAPLFYSVSLARSDYRAVAPQVRPDLAVMARHDIGDWGFNSQSEDGRYWKLSVFSPKSLAAWLYDRKKRALKKLYDTRPALTAAPLVGMRAVTIKSRTGQELYSYLSLPPGSDPANKGIPNTPQPLILVVHGGPHNRDSFGFNPIHQWLANRGYAALSVNMRGSIGFGKAFLNSSSGEWGTNLDDDLSDAVTWAIRNKIADPARIAIMGGSYGGYAVLRGMTRNPATYACGIDQFGPSDLTTMQSSAATYGVSALNHNEVGDPSTADGLARMKDQSPLSHADQIRNPLLVAQGTNDPAVKPSDQSAPMVAAVKAAGVPVTYLLYPDEGHGFVRAENNLSFYAVAEQFLAKCLGGRAQPLTAADMTASSVQVVEGADYIPGLTAALEAPAHKPL
jgi:acetyl esterase/lipase